MVSLEFPEENEKSHLSTSMRQGRTAFRVKAAADRFLRTGQPGRVGGAAEHRKAQQEMGTEAAHPATGEPVPLSGKDSVSNWFCPRHFCSRKITIFNQTPKHDTSGVIKVGG